MRSVRRLVSVIFVASSLCLGLKKVVIVQVEQGNSRLKLVCPSLDVNGKFTYSHLGSDSNTQIQK